MKVLLIDDEPAVRKIGTVSLSRVGGFEALCAPNADEGIALARAERPDVILMDMMMPEKDGLVAMREIHACEGLEATPVILITARVQEADIAEYLAGGAAGVIHKPFDPLRLPDEVRRLVRAWRPD